MNPKISPKEHFLPTFLTDILIKNTEMRPINIEEEKSELYYKTLNGYGEIKFKNNTEYSGYVKYGILDSEMGKCHLKFPNGTEYFGEIRQNQLTGSGEYLFNTGAVYKGEIKNGLRHGKGEYESEREGIKYDGMWFNGLKHGKGNLHIKDQMVYEGDFVEGIKNGMGRITWPSKNTYDGHL
jgi:hypothetical protein